MTRRRRVKGSARPNGPLGDALERWQAAVVRASSIDPVTTELVRLRCAHHHDCHT